MKVFCKFAVLKNEHNYGKERKQGTGYFGVHRA